MAKSMEQRHTLHTSKQKVFISYAHEGDISEQVNNLALWLKQQGVEVVTDHPFRDRPPEEGWITWMLHQIEDSKIVLIVCNQRYKDLFERRVEPERGGKGVTFEGAVIMSELYDGFMNNSKFFPILPDDGNADHIPIVLKDWDCHHQFPSGYDRILKLIQGDEDDNSQTAQTSQSRLTGELIGAEDPRLNPRQSEIIGRTTEINEILEFCNSKANCAHVWGPPGIGKTEVCKASIRQWLKNGGNERTFWVQVEDNADVQRLIQQLGEAVDVNPEVLAGITDMSNLGKELPKGFYYLDNLENVAAMDEGLTALRKLVAIPGLRILASSRVVLDGLPGTSVYIETLDASNGIALFQHCWKGKEPPDENELSDFVREQLGCHPLSIVLLARLGRAYSLQELKELWNEQGTQLATAHGKGPQDSLSISLSLSRKLLATTPGALDMWQFIALFPEGCSIDILRIWENICKSTTGRIALLDNAIITMANNHLYMLPPLARFALEGQDFQWEQVRERAYDCFIAVSKNASDTISSLEQLQSRWESLKCLRPIEQLIRIDRDKGTLDIPRIKELHNQLRNVYWFNVISGRDLLLLVNEILGDALSERVLGDLESWLGRIDDARSHYDKAIAIYQEERANLGLANARKSLGDLESRLGRIDDARSHYEKAIALYQEERANLGLANARKSLGDLERERGNIKAGKNYYEKAVELYRQEHEPMGLAYTLAEIIRCLRGHINSDSEEFKQLVSEALHFARQSGVESVQEYVKEALLEFFEKDDSKLQNFLKKILDSGSPKP